MPKDSTRRIRPRSVVVLACVALAGCGGGGTGTSHSGATQAGRIDKAHTEQATLILDFTPNAVHAGIYTALAEGWYRQAGIDLKVLAPSATTETLDLIDAGKAQFGLADGSDVASLIAKGGDAKAVLALGQRPFGGLIGLASEHLSSPAQLQGRTVGITGVPSDTAVLDTEVKDAGGDPAKVKVANVGFNGPQALVAGRIAAFTGFIPDEGVQLGLSGHPTTSFALDRWGGPSYPGLVAFTTRKLIAGDPSLVKGFVAATVKGYEAVLADPKLGLKDLLKANPGLPAGLTWASLKAYLPLFVGGQGAAKGGHATGRSRGRTAAAVTFGTLQKRKLKAMSEWMLGNGLISDTVRSARYGTNRFLPSGRH
ncbi:MAG TPA: ABC transporter substrate-binding protein [Solirubrobacteraceae bacterium]|nr:ABC transporter substrate-binding protein [Solirubrobacteraceae bacterium]